jgi:hypothetical protein
MKFVGCEVLSAVILTLRSPADVPLYFREICCFHPEDRRHAKKLTMKKYPERRANTFLIVDFHNNDYELCPGM